MILNKRRLPWCATGTLMASACLQDLANIFSFENSVGQAACVLFEKKLLESHVLCSDKRKTLCGEDQKREKNVLE